MIEKLSFDKWEEEEKFDTFLFWLTGGASASKQAKTKQDKTN